MITKPTVYGWYWVKAKHEKRKTTLEWEIARFDSAWGIDGFWVCGDEMPYYERDLEEIGPEVTK